MHMKNQIRLSKNSSRDFLNLSGLRHRAFAIAAQPASGLGTRESARRHEIPSESTDSDNRTDRPTKDRRKEYSTVMLIFQS